MCCHLSVRNHTKAGVEEIRRGVKGQILRRGDSQALRKASEPNHIVLGDRLGYPFWKGFKRGSPDRSPFGQCGDIVEMLQSVTLAEADSITIRISARCGFKQSIQIPTKSPEILLASRSWISRSGVGSEILHFWHAPRRSAGHASRSEGVEEPYQTGSSCRASGNRACSLQMDMCHLGSNQNV